MKNHVFWLLFSFRGRIGRPAYVLAVVSYALLRGSFWMAVPSAAPENSAWVLLANVTIQVLFALLTLPIAVKRLHDCDWSGKWFFAMNLAFGALALLLAGAYAVGAVALMKSVAAATGNSLAFAVAAANVIVLMLLPFWPGTEGPNTYGRRAGLAPEADDDPVYALRPHKAEAEVRGFGRRSNLFRAASKHSQTARTHTKSRIG